MIKTLRWVNRIMNGYEGKLLLLGAAAVGTYNWRLWQRDKMLAAQLRAKHSPPPTLSSTPKVSALVAAWNEQQYIDSHIRSFLALSYPNIELILCAGGTDNTLKSAQHYSGERVIVLEQQPGEGKQHALSRCLAHASGEIIYLTDADCIFAEDVLIRLLATILEEGEQATTGTRRPLDRQLDSVLPGYLWASDVVSNVHQARYSNGLLGQNAAITREALDRIDGLGFASRTGTDYQLAQRLITCNIAIRHVGTSIVPTEYPETLQAYYRQHSRWLRNLLLYGPSFGASRDVYETLRTIASGLLMLLALPAMVFWGSRVLVPWLLILIHAISSKLRYIVFTGRLYERPISVRLLACLVPLRLIDFAIWSTPVFDLLSSKRRERW